MVKTILVPIDFRVASLNTLKLALESSSEIHIAAILIYAEHLNDSITDLLFYKPRRIINSLLSPEFKEALEILKNRYEGKLIDIEIKLFHGVNKNYLNNFLEANKVTHIYVPKDYKLKTSARSFDPLQILKKSDLPIFEMQWINSNNQSEQEQLSSLFN